MPNITINMSKQINNSVKNTLQIEIGNIMSVIPGKTIANTVICINDSYSIFKNGYPLEGVFIDVRLYKNSPEESKREFSKELFSIIEKVLDIPPQCVQINFIELSNWASNGDYK